MTEERKTTPRAAQSAARRAQRGTAQPADRDDSRPPNFVHEAIDEDLQNGRYTTVKTRFPPEPNGYLHIGHAKSICLNFGAAARTPGGQCNLRFDDTNPETEDIRFVESIQRDIRWLGFDWEDRLYFASDYFDQLYAWAIELVKKGKAYVDSQTSDQIRENRGNYYKPGVDSPYRDRSVEENLGLLEKMRAGEIEEGAAVLRAKIDMRSPNLNLRDPLMYRIRKAPHHRTGTRWCIYPMYDWAHGQSDAIEGITHSICTLEFEDHRPLYDWFLDQLGLAPRPRQIEFARLAVSYTVMSKRVLQRLVREKHVDGWDDPRMPTLAGMRRRGYSPEALRAFAERVGVARRDGVVDVALLEHTLREDLNTRSPRAMTVLRPLRVVIENFPEGKIEHFEALNHPEHPERGTRSLPFSRVVYVERDDFREDAPKKWYRLAPGREVRLRYACLVTCRDVVRDERGEVKELVCTWDPDSRGGSPKDGRKVPGTLHWVDASQAIDAEVRLYDRLFSVEDPLGEDPDRDFTAHLNPASLEVLRGCKLEPSLAKASPGDAFQFERLGYFCFDLESRAGRPVLNRTIELRDSWAKLEQKLDKSP